MYNLSKNMSNMSTFQKISIVFSKKTGCHKIKEAWPAAEREQYHPDSAL